MARHPGGRTCGEIFSIAFWIMLPLRVAFYHATGRQWDRRKDGGR